MADLDVMGPFAAATDVTLGAKVIVKSIGTIMGLDILHRLAPGPPHDAVNPKQRGARGDIQD